jgi:DNA-binding transcriptional regulator YiaG
MRNHRLGQLLGIAHRTVEVKFDHFKQRFSPRKLISANPKTLGGRLLLKRIKADLSQPELAVKAGVSARKVKAWEHDQIIPTVEEWEILANILHLDFEYPKD